MLSQLQKPGLGGGGGRGVRFKPLFIIKLQESQHFDLNRGWSNPLNLMDFMQKKKRQISAGGGGGGGG